MRIHVAAVGRLKSGPEKTLAAFYLERAETLGRTAGISAVTVADSAESRAGTAPLRIADETRRLVTGVPDDAVRVALDSDGRNLTSEQFAATIGRQRDAGTAMLAFFIGGPDGLGPEIKAQASLSLAFGQMTWPHRLARIMLLEQVYRAVTILINHPYHRM